MFDDQGGNDLEVFYNRVKERSTATGEVKKQEYPTTVELKEWECSTREEAESQSPGDSSG